jgi:hypothetical protein
MNETVVYALTWATEAVGRRLMETSAEKVHQEMVDDIIHEKTYYPVSHFLLPMIYYKLTGLLWPTLVLMAYWEYFEQLMILIFQSFFWYPNNHESEADSVVSDLTMGLLGTAVSVSFAYVLMIPRPAIPVWKKSEVVKLVKLNFQFLSIGVLTIVLEVFAGDVAVGYLIFWVGTVVLMALYAYWNRDDERWISVRECFAADEYDASKVYIRVRVSTLRYALEESYFLLVLIFVFASSYVMFWSPFLIMCLDAAVLLFLLFTLVFGLRYHLLPESGVRRQRVLKQPLLTMVAR